MRNYLHTAPSDVVRLYLIYQRGARAMGWPIKSIQEWAIDREGLHGYECVDRWLAQLRKKGELK